MLKDPVYVKESSRSNPFTFEARIFAKAIMKSLGELNTKDKMIKKFLKCDPADHESVRDAYPGYMKTQGLYTIDQLLKQPQAEVVRKCSFGGDGELVNATYKNLEIAPDEYQNVVEEGVVFFKWKTVPVMLSVLVGAESEVVYDLTCNRKNAMILPLLMVELRRLEVDHNLFRGKPIEIHARQECKFLKGYPTIDWQDMIVSEEIKREVNLQLVQVVNDHDYHEKHKLPWRRGLLLEGLPGTGKTMIGKLLLNKVKATFMLVSSKSIYDSYDVRRMFEAARRFAPTVIFFEDIDLLAYGREHGNSNGILGELLTQMDGVGDSEGLFVVASTNDKRALDKALTNRPNRFDSILEFKLPDEKQRLAILALYNEKYQCDFGAVDLQSMAGQTEGFTPAFLNELMVYAKMLAVGEGVPPNNYHLHTSLKKIRGLVAAQQQAAYA